MRTLTRWAARMYPRAWRDRYGEEFDQLLEDSQPSARDFFNIVAGALMETGQAQWAHAGLASALLYPRPAIATALAAYLMLFAWFVAASHTYVAPMPIRPSAPPPPPPPGPFTDMTDPRVYRDVPQVYSSLPILAFGRADEFQVRVAGGVGIYFPPLADLGTTDRSRNPARRVWPGQALESSIVQRVIPRHPAGGRADGVARVFLEYLIGTNGSVTVLRASGPSDMVDAARSALENWRYRPIWFEDRVMEVVTRVEMKFDGELARSAH